MCVQEQLITSSSFNQLFSSMERNQRTCPIIKRKISQTIQSHSHMTELHAEVLQRLEGNTGTTGRIMKSISFKKETELLLIKKYAIWKEKKVNEVNRSLLTVEMTGKGMTILESIPNEINRGSWEKKGIWLMAQWLCLDQHLWVWFDECLQKESTSKAAEIRNCFSTLLINSITKNSPWTLR